MPIPREVLDVKRPVNTVVIAYGKNKDLYAVRQRIGCKYVNGRHVPINGPTIGHIVNLVYVPNDESSLADVSASPVDLKDWANVVLCDRVFSDIRQDLLQVYSKQDTGKLYCISILRVCNSGIKDYELKEAYDDSFLSELYPGVALSKNTVSTFLNDLGKACSKITKFMRNRTAAVDMDHHLLVDGTLKSDESTVNTLSDFSRKAKKKGTRDISVLYAFDLEAMEPVCSKCFPGNMLDATAYESFIKENGITKGIIVGDKGFPESAAKTEFDSHPDLHYLNPVKRNAKAIIDYNLLDFTGILENNGSVLYKKEKHISEDKWYYSFRNVILAAQEEKNWVRHAKTNDKYSLEVLLKKQMLFGTIVLESDLDLTPEAAYTAYSSRWEIEIVMRFYKTACEFEDTRVQDDYSVIGSEFCDFLSTILTFRLIHAFDKAKLLENMTYKKIMSILARAKKTRVDDGAWQLIRLNPSYITILQELELLPKPEEPAKKKCY
ncbi:MAG: transposase [Lachnospiraceae bacterium]|nr:transposase [Lachnospiraceae bacterium]